MVPPARDAMTPENGLSSTREGRIGIPVESTESGDYPLLRAPSRAGNNSGYLETAELGATNDLTLGG